MGRQADPENPPAGMPEGTTGKHELTDNSSDGREPKTREVKDIPSDSFSQVSH